jgi:hypothetical protein
VPAGKRQFGKVPYRVIAGGQIADLGRSELAAYLVIAAHVNGRTWVAEVGVARIARLIGRSPSTARRAIRRLESRDLVGVKIGGGSRANTYTLNTTPVVKSDRGDPGHTYDRGTTPHHSQNGLTPPPAEGRPPVKAGAGQTERTKKQKAAGVAAPAGRRPRRRPAKRSVAARIRDEDAATERPDAEWVRAEAARYGFGDKT